MKHDYEHEIVVTGPPVEPSWVARQGPHKTATVYTCKTCGDKFSITHYLIGIHDEKFKEECPGTSAA
jgi:hypothetical protein